MQMVLFRGGCAKEQRQPRRAFSLLKRLFDFTVSFMMLVVLLPLLLLVAAVVAVDTKANPLFVQERVGRGNVRFQMYKFRTMNINAPANVATHKLENPEKYISKLGAFLRKSSLDELPQLLNILIGDMSFIGPRPVVPTERDLVGIRSVNGANRVRPGLTGWAQVNGRDGVPVTEKAMLDAYYARHFSFKMDWLVIRRTLRCVLRSEGVIEGANPEISSRHSSRRSA